MTHEEKAEVIGNGNLNLKNLKTGDTYTLKTVCYNCSERSYATLKKGEKFTDGIRKCNNCGCNTVVKSVEQ